MDEFNSVADGEVLACIRAQEDAGVDIISDGEQRRDNFYSFAVDKLTGMQLMKVSELLDYSRDRARMEEMLRALDVPSFAIKSPIAVDRVGKRQGLALDELAFIREHTDRQIKIPLPGPYMLTRSSWFEGLSNRVYPDPEDLAADVVAILQGRDYRPAGPRLRLRPVGRANTQPGGIRRGKHRDLHVRRPAQPPRSDR